MSIINGIKTAHVSNVIIGDSNSPEAKDYYKVDPISTKKPYTLSDDDEICNIYIDENNLDSGGGIGGEHSDITTDDVTCVNLTNKDQEYLPFSGELLTTAINKLSSRIKITKDCMDKLSEELGLDLNPDDDWKDPDDVVKPPTALEILRSNLAEIKEYLENKIDTNKINTDNTISNNKQEALDNLVSINNQLDNKINTTKNDLEDKIDDLEVKLNNIQVNANQTLYDHIENNRTELENKIINNTKTLEETINNVNENLDNKINNVKDQLNTSISNVNTTLSNKIDTTKNGLTVLINNTKNDLQASINNVNTTLTNNLNDLDTQLTNKINTMNTNITNNINSVNNTLNSKITNNTSRISKLESDLGGLKFTVENGILCVIYDE